MERDHPQLNLRLIGGEGFCRFIKTFQATLCHFLGPLSLFGASCFSKYNFPPLEKLTLTDCFHHCPLLFSTLCHFSEHCAWLTIILLPLFQQNGSSGIDLESVFSSLSISFCNPDRRLLGRAEKRGRISFMRTSKEIHISFWIREALDGTLIAGFKSSDCDHHTFSAQLKFPKIFLNSKIIQVSWSSTLSWKEAVKLPIKSNLWDLLLRILGHPFITLWRCIWEFPLHSIFCHHPDFWKVIFELTNCRSGSSCLLRLRVWFKAFLSN